MKNGYVEKNVLISDNDWNTIDGEICRVIDFKPIAVIENGKVSTKQKTLPYATITIECKKFSKHVTGYIFHKVDFKHLWLAFKERTVKQDEEVLLFWSKKHYKSYVQIIASFMPRLWLMICHKEAFELMTNNNYKTEMSIEERTLATLPIVDWKPNVMK